MLGFTKRTDYALVALARLAEEPSRSEPTAVSARRIAERHNVPVPVLMNVLKDLVGSGLVSSTRGARGGYALARSAERISVRDVIEAMEGPVKVVACCAEDEDTGCVECNVFVGCPVTSSVRKLNDRIQEFLANVTLRDLMSDHLGAIGPVPQFIPVPTRLSKALGER